MIALGGRSDARGQSEVLSTVLMVSVAVILAAVIGAIVFDVVPGQPNPAPAADFDFDYDESAEELRVTLASGQDIHRDRLSFRGSEGGVSTVSPFPEQPVTSGDSVVLGDVGREETVRLIWTAKKGETSATLATWDGRNEP